MGLIRQIFFASSANPICLISPISPIDIDFITSSNSAVVDRQSLPYSSLLVSHHISGSLPFAFLSAVVTVCLPDVLVLLQYLPRFLLSDLEFISCKIPCRCAFCIYFSLLQFGHQLFPIVQVCSVGDNPHSQAAVLADLPLPHLSALVPSLLRWRMLHFPLLCSVCHFLRPESSDLWCGRSYSETCVQNNK